MKITLSWIKNYVPDLDVSPQEFADRMTMSGTKVTGWERTGQDLENIIIGQVLEVKAQHDANNLKVIKLDIGQSEPITCVTAAGNLSTGDKVPVALAGGKVRRLHDSGAAPEGGVTIHQEIIRGQVSQGVLCSVEELGFTREAAADDAAYEIYVFDQDARVGADAVRALDLDDVIFTFEPTAARKDCFRVLGIAREVAAVFGLKFVAPEVSFKETEEKIEDILTVKVKDGVLCPRYCSRVIRNIQLGASPRWLQQRLISTGIRPVNNLVDILNFVMEEYGQPVLAFDLDSLEGHQIVLEHAEDGDKFRTPDGQLRNVGSHTLMITDGSTPVGIAGIMGGQRTKVEESGKTIVLEAACFDGAYILRESRQLGITTEFSRRFERGIDPNYAEEALSRACQLIARQGCGEVVSGMIDECSTVVGSRRIAFSADWINHLLGTEIAAEEMIGLLEDLGCTYDADNNDIITPSGRQDLVSQAELAGEISRLYGYDRIPVTIPRVETTRGSLPRKMRIEEIGGEVAEFYGFSQIMTYPFEDPATCDKLRLSPDSPEREAIRIRNPLSEETSILRTTPVGAMLRTLGLNAERRHVHVCLYEMATVYLPKDLSRNELPDERMQFVLGAYGRGDFFTMKGIVEEFLRRVGIEEVTCTPDSVKPFLHPGRQAFLRAGGVVLGYLGEVHPKVAAAYGIPERSILAVIDMPEVLKLTRFVHVYKGLNRHVRVGRDLSFLAPDKMPTSRITRLIRDLAGAELEKLELKDVYQGEQVPRGEKAQTWRLRFQAEDHDLTDKEVSAAMSKIIEGLTEAGIHIR